MLHRFRVTALAVSSALVVLSCVVSAAHANPLSLLGGNCGSQVESQVFAPWGDFANYTPVAGGSFEAGSTPWLLAGATPASGNESFNVAGPGAQSLALPSGSVATSPFSCTNIYHPTLRLFVRNDGAPSSRLTVQALYPGLLGNIQVATIASLTASSQWAPSPIISLLSQNLVGTLSLSQTVIAFRFVPADSAGRWSVDDVYLDPYMRSR